MSISVVTLAFGGTEDVTLAKGVHLAILFPKVAGPVPGPPARWMAVQSAKAHSAE